MMRSYTIRKKGQGQRCELELDLTVKDGTNREGWHGMGKEFFSFYTRFGDSDSGDDTK
jgi:hypothetical protein